MEYKYEGDKVSTYYEQLWSQRRHLVRRVDSYRLLDSERLERAITLDISNQKILDPSGSPTTQHPQTSLKTITLPILLINKHPFFDVDVDFGSGQSLHLCRREKNIHVSAHIIVGTALRLGMNSSNSVELYQKAKEFLGDESPRSSSQKENLRRGLIEAFKSYDTYSMQLLSYLMNNYIQCVEYPIDLDRDVSVLKFKFVDTVRNAANGVHDSLALIEEKNKTVDQSPAPADDISDDSSFIKRDPAELELEQPETPAPPESPHKTGTHDNKVVDAEQPNLGQEQQEKDREEKTDRIRWAFDIVKQRIRACTESLGLSSISIDLAQIVHGYRVSASRHIRFTAPQGMYIEDAQLHREPKSPDYSGSTLLNHNRSAVAAMLRVQDENICRLHILLQPRFAPFLIPACMASVLQFCIAVIALQVGPLAVARNAGAFTGTAFVAPFVAVLFVVKESEHDFVARVLRFPRLALMFSSVSLVITGALLSVLPRSSMASLECRWRDRNEWVLLCEGISKTEHASSLIMYASFAGLTLVLACAGICIIMFSNVMLRAVARNQLVQRRVNRMRSYVRTNGGEADESESYRKQFLVVQSIMYLVLIVVSLCFYILVLLFWLMWRQRWLG